MTTATDLDGLLRAAMGDPTDERIGVLADAISEAQPGEKVKVLRWLMMSRTTPQYRTLDGRYIHFGDAHRIGVTRVTGRYDEARHLWEQMDRMIMNGIRRVVEEEHWYAFRLTRTQRPDPQFYRHVEPHDRLDLIAEVLPLDGGRIIPLPEPAR